MYSLEMYKLSNQSKQFCIFGLNNKQLCLYLNILPEIKLNKPQEEQQMRTLYHGVQTEDPPKLSFSIVASNIQSTTLK